MLAQQVGKKYGGALFQLAKDKNLIDHAWEQFNGLAEFLRKDRTFLDLMAAPQIPDEEKEKLIAKIFQGRFDTTFFNFILVLTRKRRIGYIIDIVEEFDRLVRIEKGIEKAACITAIPLSKAERSNLIAKLTAKTGLKIELEEKVDKAIIGGMIVILHNQIIDGSIRYGLQLLKNRLMKVKVH